MIKHSKNLPPWGNLVLEPTPAQCAAWDALTREEQLAVFREAVDGPEARTDSGMSLDDVLIRARARSAAKSHVRLSTFESSDDTA